MTCFFPLDAFQLDNGEISFTERGAIRRKLILPCGQCTGCRLERSRQWATRCIHEAQMHKENCFITLTYNDENIQHDLIYRHFQKFLKRFRKAIAPKQIRYYMCGEYGEQTGRPHFHACIFGYDFPDRVLFKQLDSGSSLYLSAELESLWPFGYSTVGDVTFESAAYVARYVMKKVTGRNAENRYWSVNPITGEAVQITPEFNRMSLKPGIGATWFDKYHRDIYNAGQGQVRINGQLTKAPRYYDKKYENINPFKLEDFQYERSLKINPFDQTAERLAVRHEVCKAKLKLKLRGKTQ
jgi:hypothetical protein